MDIREHDCVIIRKGNEYLVGRIIFSTDLRWSTSAYDAWRTRDQEAAQRVAGKVGGQMMLFNPIVGKIRKM